MMRNIKAQKNQLNFQKEMLHTPLSVVFMLHVLNLATHASFM